MKSPSPNPHLTPPAPLLPQGRSTSYPAFSRLKNVKEGENDVFPETLLSKTQKVKKACAYLSDMERLGGSLCTADIASHLR